MANLNYELNALNLTERETAQTLFDLDTLPPANADMVEFENKELKEITLVIVPAAFSSDLTAIVYLHDGCSSWTAEAKTRLQVFGMVESICEDGADFDAEELGFEPIE